MSGFLIQAIRILLCHNLHWPCLPVQGFERLENSLCCMFEKMAQCKEKIDLIVIFGQLKTRGSRPV